MARVRLGGFVTVKFRLVVCGGEKMAVPCISCMERPAEFLILNFPLCGVCAEKDPDPNAAHQTAA
jgi:hypothetical protein